MISLIFLSLFVIPFLKAEFHERDLRVLGFWTPTTYTPEELSRMGNAIIPFTWDNAREMLDTCSVLSEVTLDGKRMNSQEEVFREFQTDLKRQDSLKALYQSDKYVVHFLFDSAFNYSDLIAFLSLTQKYGHHKKVIDWELRRLSMYREYEYPKVYHESMDFTCGLLSIEKPIPKVSSFEVFARDYQLTNRRTQLILLCFIGLFGVSSMILWKK